MFSQACVKNSVHGGGGGIPACIAGGIPACLADIWRGVVSQHALHGGGGLQAHTQGEAEGSGQGGLQARRGFPACTEADRPPWTATAAGGTHPTGMHSCVD